MPAHPRGQAVYKHALQLEVLERELLATLPGAGASDTPEAAISIAANADSLATWLVPALVQFGQQTGARVEVVVDDQDHTAEWLRSGRVLGAVTAEAQPVQGCRVQPLGVMRYRATAAPRFVRQHFGKTITAAELSSRPGAGVRSEGRAAGALHPPAAGRRPGRAARRTSSPRPPPTSRPRCWAWAGG